MLRNMGWRLFPVWLITAMLMVAAVNGYLVYAAVQSFPGQAGADGFDLSNSYDKVINTAQQQAALGWRLDATIDTARRPVLRLVSAVGTPLPLADIDAKAERPVGPEERTLLAFRDAGAGRYEAVDPLAAGQWDVLLTVRADGHTYTTTRRLTVP